MSGARPVRLVVTAHAVAAVVLALVVLLGVGTTLAGQSLNDGLPYLVLLVVTIATGWLLSTRVPRNTVGWLLVSVPLLFVSGDLIGLLGDGLRGALPGLAVWLTWYSGTDAIPSWSWVPPVWVLLCQLPLRFPTGHLPGPGWRWFQRFTVLALVLVCAVIGISPPDVDVHVANPVHIAGVPPWVDVIAFGSLAISVLVSIASLVVRGRLATPLIRAQLRWILWSMLGLLLAWLIGVVLTAGTDYLSWLLLLYALIPVSVGVAVLKYRLYEIDRIISRTAAYVVVILVVIGVYGGVVLLVSAALHGPSGTTPPIAVAAATLAALLGLWVPGGAR